PIFPPMLTARLIEDGPGYRFLRRTCPESGFVACRYLSRLPTSTDDFLWSHDPSRGVFGSADALTRRALSREQWDFALAVLRDDPWGQARASALNALRQVVLVGVPEFRYSSEEKADFSAKLPPSYSNPMRRTPAYRGAMPVDVLTMLTYCSMVVA